MTYEDGSEVTISGLVRAEELIEAPLTRELCVLHWTHARVWDRLDVAGSLVDDLVLLRHAPFVIETGGEPVHVTGQGAFAVDIKPVAVSPHPVHAMALLGRYARYVRSTFFDHVVIRPGESITVTGVVARDVDHEAEHGYRETAVLTRLVGYDGRPLKISRWSAP